MFVRSTNKQMGAQGWGPADASTMRAHNVSMVLYSLIREEPISRAALARKTGLARSTVTTIVTDLIDTGLVTESHVAASRGGRPPIALRVVGNRYHMVGVELGASHITALRSDLMGGVREVVHEAFDVEGHPHDALRRVLEILRPLLTNDDGGPVVGVGLAVPSPLDPSRPGLLSERILPKWSGIRPMDLLSRELGLPVYMENDANLGVLAEAWWGAGQDRGDFAYIKLATGVGSGLLIGGNIYRGSSGVAGEIGHTSVRSAGRRCRCGLIGCLEALAGTRAILDEARLRVAEEEFGPEEVRDLDDFLKHVRSGTPWAVEVANRAGHDIGVAVANLVNLLNPGLVVLGGTLTGAGEHLLSPLLKSMRERSLGTSVESTEVVLSALGDTAISRGAAALVLERVLAEPSTLLCAPTV